MSAKHTPGPWAVLKDERSASGEMLHTVAASNETVCYGVMRANARLIAAAPDLLAVLLRARDAIEALDGTSIDNEKLVDDYRAAIAKATGEKA